MQFINIIYFYYFCVFLNAATKFGFGCHILVLKTLTNHKRILKE